MSALSERSGAPGMIELPGGGGARGARLACAEVPACVRAPAEPGAHAFFALRPGLGRAAYELSGPPAGGPPRPAYDRGTSLAGRLPRHATLALVPDGDPQDLGPIGPGLAPGRVLPDLLLERSGLVVGSVRLRALFLELGVRGVEWLPVRIVLLGRILVSREHYLLNVLTTVPALDMARSTYERDPEDPDHIARLRSAVLDAEAIDPTVHVLRPATFRRLILFRSDVVEAIAAAGLAAGPLVALEDWDRPD